MKKETTVKKNLDLLNEFMKYAFERPSVLDEIPPDAELVILPIDDTELFEHNKSMGDKLVSKGRKVIFVKMKKPEIPTAEFEPVFASQG
jgi:hypothetical protein